MDVKTAERVLAITNLVFIVFGVVGNLIAFALLMRPNVRKFSCMRYLAVLTLTDIGCLFTWNFTLVYSFFRGKKIEHENALLCRLFSFYCYFMLQTSSWMICSIGMDRIVTVLSVSKTNCLVRTAKNTRIVSLAVFLIFFLVNSPVLIFNAEPFNPPVVNGTRARSSREYTCYEPKAFFSVWDIEHIIVYSLLPFLVILIENLSLGVLTIRHSRQMQKHMKASYPSDRVFTISSPQSETTQSSTFRERLVQRFDKTKRVYRKRVNLLEGKAKDGALDVLKLQAKRNKRAQSKTSHVARLLLFLTISFLFTTVPYSTYYALRLDISSYELRTIIVGVLALLQYARHSANFLIYLLTSSVIKNEVKQMIGSLKRKYLWWLMSS
nr:G protein-coupled receptor [Proales similis]